MIYIHTYIHIYMYESVWSREGGRRRVRIDRWLICVAPWASHNIATANIVWCMAYTRGVGLGSYIAHWSFNSIAIV